MAKICPLMRIANSYDGKRCLREQCAWWVGDEKVGECCMVRKMPTPDIIPPTKPMIKNPPNEVWTTSDCLVRGG